MIAFQVEQLKEIQNAKKTELKICALDKILKYATEMMTPLLAEKNNKIALKTQKISARVDENKYLQAIINIIKNASEHTVDDVINIELLSCQDDTFAKIKITNHGEKINEPNKIFESGFSTKGTMGVGLSVSKKYLQEQFSTLELSCSNEESTEFVITTQIEGANL
jgi:signal transduction histidine kinase